jgi:predicted dehydrogenase/NADPH:quinone reductase-like Zn-dependent oxidoreductase
MNQLTQKLGSGQMGIQNVPVPLCGSGMVLVQNHYSVISAGTEGSTVRAARSSFLDKVRQRPEQVHEVLDLLARQGPVQTYRAVTKKLDAYSPLGYSSAGRVLEFGSAVSDIAVGDFVACAGVGYASHAEIIAVPVNLCVKLPNGADLRLAAYNAIGAIALQGVRQADLHLGESAAVVGLGLVGQLTCMLLRASGIRVFGIDLDPGAVEFAVRHSADFAAIRGEEGLAQRITGLTGGLGVDAVIITAGTSSTDPVDFAGEIARQKGCVVIVGAVPTGFQREHFYRKELELRMSCSYGPGRYDPQYEELGIDYPAAYVRWTEQRNMAAFQDMIHSRRVDIGCLTTHEFAIEEAPRAYDLILNRTEPFLGILLRYDFDKSVRRQPIRIARPKPASAIGIGFIGAGSYAQSNLLPNLPRNDPSISCKGVATNTGTTSRRAAERFGFEYCTSSAADILADPVINTVFIATRHDAHCRYVVDALNAGKHVFVEKPLALNEDELGTIVDCYSNLASQDAAPSLMVGFNRRFAPLACVAKQRLGSGPMSMIYRINAGAIPATHWTQHPSVGGGRVIGEVCHFIDFLTFLCGAVPVRVFASAIPDPLHSADTVSINIEFADNSIGSICYYSNGSKAFDKEYVEAYSSGVTAILRDFRKLEVAGAGRTFRKSLLTQDKGQSAMVAEFLSSVRNGRPAPIPFDEILGVTIATFAAVKSIATRQPISLV